MQALAERLDAFACGPRPARRSDLLSFSSLKTFSPPVEDLYGQILRVHHPAGQISGVDLRRRAPDRVHLSQAGRVDVESPPKTTRPRGMVARFIFSRRWRRRRRCSTGTRRASRTEPEWRSSSVSTERSARHRGGCWPPVTTDRWMGLGPEPDSRGVCRTDPHQHELRAVSTPICAISGWWPGSGGVGVTTSCIGPACRRLPRWVRSTPRSGSACSPPRRRCSTRRSPSSARRAGGPFGGEAGWSFRRARKVRPALPDARMRRQDAPGLVRVL